MTIRTTEFTATMPTMPTMPVIDQPKTQQTESNPLAAFFRKSKLSLSLPSRGRWYSKSSLQLNEQGGLDIYAMKADDDIKFRSGDFTLNGKNVYDVIRSCVPGILEPELVPNIDIDAILLGIRAASYGNEFDCIVDVPNTKLSRTVRTNALDLLNAMANQTNTWDEFLQITDESGKSLSLTVAPVPIKNVFETSKFILNQRKALSRAIDKDDNISDETAFSSSIDSLTKSAIDLICMSIRAISVLDANGQVTFTLDASNPQDSAQIMNCVRGLDVAYFYAIRNHIEAQKNKYLFRTVQQTSTPEEILAGAPEVWTAELSFLGSNFLPDNQ